MLPQPAARVSLGGESLLKFFNSRCHV
jgi:hypothetical protein